MTVDKAKRFHVYSNMKKTDLLSEALEQAGRADTLDAEVRRHRHNTEQWHHYMREALGFMGKEPRRFDFYAEEVKKLRGNDIECHYQRDVLASLYEAMAKLPCCGINAILCAASQEIQALRCEILKLRSELLEVRHG